MSEKIPAYSIPLYSPMDPRTLSGLIFKKSHLEHLQTKFQPPTKDTTASWEHKH